MFIKSLSFHLKRFSEFYVCILFQMKAVFSKENYVPTTIYLFLELICEMSFCF